MTLLTRRRLWLWGTAVAALGWFVYLHGILTPGLYDRAGRFKGMDFIQFHTMGALVQEGRAAELYDADAHKMVGWERIEPGLIFYAPHPNYPPYVGLIFAPLAALPFAPALVLYLGLVTMVYGAAVALLWRECHGLRRAPALVAVLALGFPAFLAMLKYGQLSSISLLLFVLVLAAWQRRKPLFAGAALGLLAYKPQLALVGLLVLLLDREWRAVAGAAATAVLPLAASAVVLGIDTLRQYVSALLVLLRDPLRVQLFPTEGHSLRGFFQLLVPWPALVTLLCGVSAVFVLVLTVQTWRSNAPAPVKWGQVVLATILVSPHLLTYDLVLLTLPLMAFGAWIAESRRVPGSRGPVGWSDAAAGRDAVRVLVPVAVLSAMAYFASFSGLLIARRTGIQASTLILAALSWSVWRSTRPVPRAEVAFTNAPSCGSQLAASVR